MSRGDDVEQAKGSSSSQDGVAFPRSSSPTSHGGEPGARHARTRTSSSARRRSLQAPILDPHSSTGASAQSPLAKLGIKGDGLMLFVTCFASLGVLLFGYDQVRSVLSSRLARRGARGRHMRNLDLSCCDAREEA
jgi:hypothetical protein